MNYLLFVGSLSIPSVSLSTVFVCYLGADWVTSGLERGSDKIAKVVEKQSESIKKDIKPAETDLVVDPRVQTSVHYLRQGTHVAVKVSGYLGIRSFS